MKKLIWTIATILLVVVATGILLTKAEASGPLYKQVLDTCEQVQDISVTNSITEKERAIEQLQREIRALKAVEYNEVCTYKSECNVERYDVQKDIIGCFDFGTDKLYTTLDKVDCNWGGPNRRNVYNVTQQQAQQILDAGVACEDVSVFASHCNRESYNGYDGVHPDKVSYGECGITRGKWLDGVEVYNQGPTMQYAYALDSLKRANYDYQVWIRYWNYNDKSRREAVRGIKNYYNAYYSN